MSVKSKLIGLWTQINNAGTPRRRYGRKRLKRMATAHVHRQIDRARKEGRFPRTDIVVDDPTAPEYDPGAISVSGDVMPWEDNTTDPFLPADVDPATGVAPLTTPAE
jgi:hypothetical protein